MGRIKLKQIELDTLLTVPCFDIVICSSGYETRASFLADKLKDKKIDNKFVLSFKDNKDVSSRKKNDQIFENLNYTFIEKDKDENTFLKDILLLINDYPKDRHINILVDYSSMSRTWFASFINAFQYSNSNTSFYFSYSVAKFKNPNPNISPSIKFDPIPGFNNLSIPDKPTALIIGLGYEKGRASGLIEYFDAQEVFLFHTDNEDYQNEITKANKQIIKQVKSDNIIPYPLKDIEYTYTILSNICTELSDRYRIIIAPCGPKPFSIISYVIGLQLGYVDIWRISGENDPIKGNRLPSGEMIIFQLDKIN